VLLSVARNDGIEKNQLAMTTQKNMARNDGIEKISLQ